MRKGTVVYKYDQEGNLQHTYTSLHMALIGERTSLYRLRNAIQNKTLFKGYYFQSGDPYKRTKRAIASWEGRDGIFDIDMWSKMAY